MSMFDCLFVALACIMRPFDLVHSEPLLAIALFDLLVQVDELLEMSLINAA